MHQAKWTALRTNTDYIFGSTVYYTYTSDTPYTPAMLVEDLMEAGVKIEKVTYESDGGPAMQYHGGQLSAEAFLKEYDGLKKAGWSGMDYTVFCRLNDVPFRAGMADNGSGHTYNRIILMTDSPCFDLNHLILILEKQT